MTKGALLRLWPLALLACGLAAFFAFGGTQIVNQAWLREHHAELKQAVALHPLATLFLYGAIYCLLEACGPPVGVPMMIVSGFLFGALAGAILSVTAATAGAVLTWWAARTALGPLLAETDRMKLAEIQQGLRRNAFVFLFSTRLLPFFPFFAINFAAGTLNMPLAPFIAASLIGLFPAAFIYAILGTGLDGIFAQGGAVNAGLLYQPRILLPLIGLAVLSLLPVLWRLRRS
jgi:uncharacterized membrane protein YdjX (TVP38/TMEM64 family)